MEGGTFGQRSGGPECQRETPQKGERGARRGLGRGAGPGLAAWKAERAIGARLRKSALGGPEQGTVLLRRQGPRRHAEPKMRASVVLTCYCWLLVRVSEPAPTSRRGASCSGPLGSPPSPSASGRSVGPGETIQSRMLPIEPYQTLGCWTREFSYSHRCRGFVRSGVQVLLDPRPREDLGPGLAVLLELGTPLAPSEKSGRCRATCSGFASDRNCCYSVVKYFSFHLLVRVFV